MALNQHIYIAADAVIFGKIADQWHVLLIKRGNEPYKDMWAFPGGFVEDDEDLEPAAIRELYEETQLKVDKLQQLYAIGTPGRDPRMRTVSIIFYGTVNPEEQQIQGGDDAKEARWWNMNALPAMAFDHAPILQDAFAQVAK
jgi:8-oxo-dGTP diphosphatase